MSRSDSELDSKRRPRGVDPTRPKRLGSFLECCCRDPIRFGLEVRVGAGEELSGLPLGMDIGLTGLFLFFFLEITSKAIYKMPSRCQNSSGCVYGRCVRPTHVVDVDDAVLTMSQLDRETLDGIFPITRCQL